MCSQFPIYIDEPTGIRVECSTREWLSLDSFWKLCGHPNRWYPIHPGGIIYAVTRIIVFGIHKPHNFKDVSTQQHQLFPAARFNGGLLHSLAGVHSSHFYNNLALYWCSISPNVHISPCNAWTYLIMLHYKLVVRTPNVDILVSIQVTRTYQVLPIYV